MIFTKLTHFVVFRLTFLANKKKKKKLTYSIFENDLIGSHVNNDKITIKLTSLHYLTQFFKIEK